MSRLDYFIVPQHLAPYISADIVSGFRSDHACPVINIGYHELERGKGFWKINNALLEDNDYHNQIIDTIKEAGNKYDDCTADLKWDMINRHYL